MADEAAPDFARIKGNVAKMIGQGAPENEIDTYLFHERVTPAQLQAAPRVTAMPAYDVMGNATGHSEDTVGPAVQPSPMRDQIDDITKSIGGGLVRGAAGTAGFFLDTVPGWGERGLNYLESKLNGETPEQTAARIANKRQNAIFPGVREAMTPQAFQRNLEKVTGPAYEPQTTAGKYASTAAEFVPGALIGGGGGVFRNAVTYGVLPGLASEAAGQATSGTPYEPYARGVAALAAGGAGMAAQRMGSAERLVNNAAAGMTPLQLDQMEALMLQAARQGTPLTRAEAAQAVTNGATGLGNLQHKVEGMGGMREFYSQRPAQNDAAARRVFNTIAPTPSQPSTIGPAVGQAAEGIVNDVTSAINRHTRPLYQAAEAQRIGAPVHQALMADPLYASTLDQIRSNPALNRTIAYLPDDSVGVVDLVQRRLREAADNARIPGQANTSNLAAANYQDARTAPIAAAETVTGSRPGVAGSYEAARAENQRLRDRYLQPVLAGPLGRIASVDTPTRRAIEALFPTDPLASSTHEIGMAMSALSNRVPSAARQLVRAHAEGVFNEAAQNLVSGPNQAGGARFAATLRGNAQQAANLEAAVRALPNGDGIWTGFNRFLDIMEAQGRRKAMGSETAFNAPGVDNLRSGGFINNAVQVGVGGGLKLPQKIMDAVQNWNIGRNVDEISRLFTAPEAAQRFRHLAEAPAGSFAATANFLRLANIATSDNRSGSRDLIRVYITGERANAR